VEAVKWALRVGNDITSLYCSDVKLVLELDDRISAYKSRLKVATETEERDLLEQSIKIS
jgi:hypothetical protein